jgi:hypothetical protein
VCLLRGTKLICKSIDPFRPDRFKAGIVFFNWRQWNIGFYLYSHGVIQCIVQAVIMLKVTSCQFAVWLWRDIINIHEICRYLLRWHESKIRRKALLQSLCLLWFTSLFWITNGSKHSNLNYSPRLQPYIMLRFLFAGQRLFRFYHYYNLSSLLSLGGEVVCEFLPWKDRLLPVAVLARTAEQVALAAVL